MAIRCPNCKREFDVTLFEFERTIKCVCGSNVSLQHIQGLDSLKDSMDQLQEEKKISEIRNLADKISFLIISTDYPKIDIEIEKERLKERIKELFPDKTYLYDLIYEPRFRRLEEQFRGI